LRLPNSSFAVSIFSVENMRAASASTAAVKNAW
jgi:hypothetical protein